MPRARAWAGARVVAAWVVVIAALPLGCSPGASASPLANADPEGPEVYFYGDATHGGKRLPDPVAARAPAGSEEPTPPTPRKIEESEDEEAESEADESEREEGDAGAAPAAKLGAVSFEKLPGSYRGTDTLKIRVDGAPEQVQTDDKAKLSVESKEKDEYVFKIVDSQNGSDLCAVIGKPKRDAIEFEPGQSCLEQILGIPMTATLESGKATLVRGLLRVDYSIALEIDAPNGPQEGHIDYHFEGRRE
jgi:hypothetical protein